MVVLIVVVAVVVLIAIALVVMYNALVRARHAWQNAYAQIDVQLSRRHDLIPNLVEVVKAYMRHEQQTLAAVTAARTAAVQAKAAAAGAPGDPAAMAGLSGAENALTGTLGRLFVVSENYPELKADQNMRQLSEELTSAENRVAFARQAYNDSVMVYKNKQDTFPSNLVGSIFSFGPAAYLELDEPRKREAPRISLDRNE
ncbi:LemA family protein [Actinophytocola sp.]|uniref:LemA family protein n=1 Tax=Actinophytocola sp. TaxID=1872138 RepID=UPI0025BE412F|nr:LemA family protein [Actinophytocola sp.]